MNAADGTGRHVLSDATPHNRPTGSLEELLGTSKSVQFSISAKTTPAEAIQKAAAMAALALPDFLGALPNADQLGKDVQGVLTELVDITARHQAGSDLIGEIKYDGTHVTVCVGDMACSLPPPEEEPGLYLVRRVAVDMGQYAGDLGGRVTWAAIVA